MATQLLGALSSVVLFAYGLSTWILYGLKAVWKGTFFKRPTEKEKLELQLGMVSTPFLSNPLHLLPLLSFL